MSNRAPHPDLATAISSHSVDSLTAGARSTERVSGWTHDFYRYPARFSPHFAAAAIRVFSRPGQTVLDPYMGGGTTIVEALAHGRKAIGNDLNALGVFIARTKTSSLTRRERDAMLRWAQDVVPTLNYRDTVEDLPSVETDRRTKNLGMARARFIKKLTAVALQSVDDLPGEARSLARCALLRVGQWALDGRSRHTNLEAFRVKLGEAARDMLAASVEFSEHVRALNVSAQLFNKNAAELADDPRARKELADLVVTSPPYPGVHVLYHRWQVDGRRETPAPYWISGTTDGRGASYYNFAGRKDPEATDYFAESLKTLTSVRSLMKRGAHIVQMIAFNRPEVQLGRYLDNMRIAGFDELPEFSEQRIWRQVPNRKWHARLRGNTHGSMEVVLVHRAR